MNRARKSARPVCINGRFVSKAQVAVLKAAARADATGRPDLARRLQAELEKQLQEGRDAEWLKGALAETAALEAVRGVTVEGGRPVRLHGRDGLDALRASGAITPAGHAAALVYRTCFEGAEPRLRSTLAFRPGGPAPAGLAEAVAERVARCLRQVGRFERAVVAHYTAGGRPGLASDAVMVLREVAGWARSVRSLAGSGSRRAALTARLGEALDVLARMAGGAAGQDR